MKIYKIEVARQEAQLLADQTGKTVAIECNNYVYDVAMLHQLSAMAKKDVVEIIEPLTN